GITHAFARIGNAVTPHYGERGQATATLRGDKGSACSPLGSADQADGPGHHRLLLLRMTLWLFLTWIPQYFLHNYHMNLKNSAVFAAGVFFAGVVGDWLGGQTTDWLLKRTGSAGKARSAMVAACNLVALVSLLPILFVHDATVAAVCLSSGFFFAEMT